MCSITGYLVVDFCEPADRVEVFSFVSVAKLCYYASWFGVQFMNNCCVVSQLTCPSFAKVAASLWPSSTMFGPVFQKCSARCLSTSLNARSSYNPASSTMQWSPLYVFTLDAFKLRCAMWGTVTHCSVYSTHGIGLIRYPA